mmetsp:Transcript_116994/g.335656  ORF Transcript_116994/g.335656 Transcript_116994/m.335656 type:complete len:234 (-) Transcript_116994:614-1315(-)
MLDQLLPREQCRLHRLAGCGRRDAQAQDLHRHAHEQALVGRAVGLQDLAREDFPPRAQPLLAHPPRLARGGLRLPRARLHRHDHERLRGPGAQAPPAPNIHRPRVLDPRYLPHIEYRRLCERRAFADEGGGNPSVRADVAHFRPRAGVQPGGVGDPRQRQRPWRHRPPPYPPLRAVHPHDPRRAHRPAAAEPRRPHELRRPGDLGAGMFLPLLRRGLGPHLGLLLLRFGDEFP